MPVFPLSLRRRVGLTILALVLVFFLGMLRLSEAFDGDQALFNVYASEIDRGAVLYTDVWDIKQPGIFIFYLIAGKLFGFNEFGIHLFELFYWLAFSFVLLFCLRDYFRNQWLLFVTPLLTAGFYYGISGTWEFTQVEGLVGFPLFLTLWTAINATKANGKVVPFVFSFLSGFFGGIVIIFKLFYSPLIVTFWISALANQCFRNKNLRNSYFLLRLFGIALGLALPLILVLGYFVWHGNLEVLLYTTFEYPAGAVKVFSGLDRLGFLIEGLKWFFLSFSSFIVLIVIGGLLSIWNGHSRCKAFFCKIIKPENREEIFTTNLVLWMVLAFILILLQGTSWWAYHFLLPLIPFGILTVKSLETIWEYANVNIVFCRTQIGMVVAVASVVIIFAPALRLPLGRLRGIIREHSFSQMMETHGDKGSPYPQIIGETKFLSQPGSEPGRIFACANPLYYYLSRRGPAISLTGWPYEFFLPAEWRKMEDEIDSKRPAYIIFDRSCFELTKANSPKTLNILATTYRLRDVYDNAYWYEIASGN